MASFMQSAQQRDERREAFKQEKQDEREGLRELCDAGIAAACGSPQKLAAFLNVMATVPNFTSRNAMLVMQQRPDAVYLESKQNWYNMGRYVKPDEKERVVKILEPKEGNRGGTLFDVKERYDITQTTGKPVKKPGTILAEGSEGMQRAFNGLAEFSPVPIVADDALPGPAEYDPGEKVIRVNDAYPDGEKFAEAVNAITHARFHREDINENRGVDRGYDYADTEFLTSCVSYVVCKRFGVPVEGKDLTATADILGQMDAEGQNAVLKMIGENARQCGNRIQQELEPQQKQRSRPFDRGGR